MAIINQLSKQEIYKNFSHYGWIFGIIPIYVGDPDGECMVAVRNWIPDGVLEIMEMIYQMQLTLLPSFT